MTTVLGQNFENIDGRGTRFVGYVVPEHVECPPHFQMYVLKSMQLSHCSEVKLGSVHIHARGNGQGHQRCQQ